MIYFQMERFKLSINNNKIRLTLQLKVKMDHLNTTIFKDNLFNNLKINQVLTINLDILKIKE